MKKTIGAALVGTAALFALATPAIASAGSDDAQLCSFNLAYRSAHKSDCASIAIGSIGHGGSQAPKVGSAPAAEADAPAPASTT